MPGAHRDFPGQAQASIDGSFRLGFGKQDTAAGPGASGNAGMKGTCSLCGGIRAVGEDTGVMERSEER